MPPKKFTDIPAETRRARNTRNFFKRSPNLEKIYEEVESHVNENKKFGIREHVTKFYFKNPPGEKAEENFKKIVKKLIDDAWEKEVEPGWENQKISINIYCSAITDPIIIPGRPKHQNTPEAVLHEFEKVQQSWRAANLMCEQMSIIVATFSSPKNLRK